MFLIFTRTFNESLKNLWRNGLLSIAAISVLVFSLYTISILYLLTATTDNILKEIQQKVNVTVYFKSDVSEENILKIRQDLGNYSEIKSADYVSKEKALDDFKKNNSDNPVILQSLEEIGDNPLLPSLVIKANNPNQYESVASYISTASFKDDIARINYSKNKEIINKLNSLVSEIRKIGLSLAILFSFIAILITFNTIRITIYSHKQEIEVMRLVGASNLYIRLPFIFEGVTYGVIASVISMIFLLITIKFVAPYISKVIPSENLLSFYFTNFAILIGMQILIGTLLGIFSGMIAIRKYLKI
jgi:cell division transport system permease protein